VPSSAIRPVLDDRDPVGVVGREQAVGKRDHGAPLQLSRRRTLEVTGGPRVDQGGRLVEHQGAPLALGQPPQPPRRPVVGDAGVVEREDATGSRYGSACLEANGFRLSLQVEEALDGQVTHDGGISTRTSAASWWSRTANASMIWTR